MNRNGNGVERRGFLARLGAFAGLAAFGAPPAAPAPEQAQGWDMSWLDRLTGKHKQVFDVGKLDPPLRIVGNWLDAHETVYSLSGPKLSAVIGIAGSAFPINAGDALYQAFPIGETWKVTDPETGKPALRNIYLDAKGDKEGRTTVRGLMTRGVIFWQCNNALLRVAGELAVAVKRPAPEVYEQLKAGLNPGTIVVPAHTMLLGLCQERGCSYEAIL
jgi:hypothetical protein